MRARSARENFGVRVHVSRACTRVHIKEFMLYIGLLIKKIYNFVQLEQLHLPLFVIVSLPLFCPLSPTTVL